MRKGLEILEAGEVLGLFPEGHVNKGEGLAPLRGGVSLFSLREGVVTIPAVMRGTDLAFKHGFPHFPKIDILVGPPLEMPGPEVPDPKGGGWSRSACERRSRPCLATPVER